MVQNAAAKIFKLFDRIHFHIMWQASHAIGSEFNSEVEQTKWRNS
jgi:hypothetical protein